MKFVFGVLAFAMLLLVYTTASRAMQFTVPADVSAGHMNVRTGPGTNHSLIGSVPAGATVASERCVPRDDGIRGADWCFVNYGGLRGWVSQAGLMPVYRPEPVPLSPLVQPLAAIPVSPNAFPTQSIEGWHVFQCYPKADARDRNPPTMAYVGVELTRTNRVLNMTVSYDLANGDHVERSNQYGAIAGNDGLIYGWTGKYVRDPSKTMAGGLFYGNDGEWHYREKQWEHGVVQYDYVVSCVPAEIE
jgi:uncharacterized protein YraI